MVARRHRPGVELRLPVVREGGVVRSRIRGQLVERVDGQVVETGGLRIGRVDAGAERQVMRLGSDRDAPQHVASAIRRSSGTSTMPARMAPQ